MRSMPELPKMLLWSRWQTSSRGSHGLCCRAEKTTGQWGILLPHEIVRKRRLRLGSAGALPLSRTTTTAGNFHPPRSARSSKDERTVTTACPQPDTENGLERATDRLIRTDTRATHPGQES